MRVGELVGEWVAGDKEWAKCVQIDNYKSLSLSLSLFLGIICTVMIYELSVVVNVGSLLQRRWIVRL